MSNNINVKLMISIRTGVCSGVNICLLQLKNSKNSNFAKELKVFLLRNFQLFQSFKLLSNFFTETIELINIKLEQVKKKKSSIKRKVPSEEKIKNF